MNSILIEKSTDYSLLKNNNDYFYHVSLEKIKDNTLSPRIPMQMGEGENNQINRICVSTSIEQCLGSIPQAHELHYLIKDNYYPGIPCLLYVFLIPKKIISTENIVYPQQVFNYGVEDALINDEHWILDTVIYFEQPYVIRLFDINQTEVTSGYYQTQSVKFELPISSNKKEYIYTFFNDNEFNMFKNLITTIGEIIHIKHSTFISCHFIIKSNINTSYLWEFYRKVKMSILFNHNFSEYENLEDKYIYF